MKKTTLLLFFIFTAGCSGQPKETAKPAAAPDIKSAPVKRPRCMVPPNPDGSCERECRGEECDYEEAGAE